MVTSKEYLSKGLPVDAVLMKSEKGFMCRLNLCPELDGGKRAGKPFFSDRSCTVQLCEGPAVITEVRDMGTYGFFKGHMKTFTAPSNEELVEYFKGRDILGTVEVMSNKFGSFVRVKDTYHKYATSCLVRGKQGVEECLYDLWQCDKAGTVLKSYDSCEEFLSQVLHGTSYEDLFASFGKFEFDRFGAEYSIHFISQLFDRAVQTGAIRLYTKYGVEFVEVSEGYFNNCLVSFTTEELRELAQVCSNINTRANEAIKSKVRKGKLILK